MAENMKEKDSKDSKDKPPEPPDLINPYIPMFISKAPWYIAGDKESLDHQKQQSEKQRPDLTYTFQKRKILNKATKYRKGACENCGSLTHKTKECLERPRKLGAKFTNKDIKPDEVLEKVELGFEGKRDRWNGYDVREHDALVLEWEELEETKRKLKEQEFSINKKQKVVNNILEDLSSSDEEEEEEVKAIKETVDTTTRSTIRNLRMREDVAKYLIDLSDDNYNPKSRAMLSDVQRKNIKYSSDLSYKFTGEAPKLVNAQIFAWDANKRGVDVNLQADPTMAEYMLREESVKREGRKKEVERGLVEKYGGEEYYLGESEIMVPKQTEVFVEYASAANNTDRNTTIIDTDRNVNGNNISAAAVTSDSSHEAVWGSYFDKDKMKWGYSCCKSIEYSSKCTKQEKER